MSPSSRRTFVQQAATGLGLMSFLTTRGAAAEASGSAPRRVVCVGAHPDDPESCCGGTLRKLADAGHRVTVVYLTRGEAGIEGTSHAEAAAIRTDEAVRACQVLGAEARFFGQVDAATVFDHAAIEAMGRTLAELAPDLVFTHWPIDAHADHQAASVLTIQARLRAARPFELYFFEAFTGEQSMGFRPTDYVDITDVHAVKREAAFCHASQQPAEYFYAPDGRARQDVIDGFRGVEFGVKAAEAFVRFTGRGARELA
ncbi:MAG TPA: PIG-L deacetylase family protein [Opitutus sp.]|nr:PIG-L deacetylase family protein [Opitutus sp.]